MAETKGEIFLADVGAFGWLVRYEHTDTWLDFDAFEVISEELSPVQGTRHYRAKGARNSGDETDDINDAEPTISGFVKWDGCSEMNIGQPHFCGAGDIGSYAEAMLEIHKLCLLLPRVDRDCAGYDAHATAPVSGRVR